MNALGSYFREKREEQGYSIGEVARKTNIGSRYIEAIEEENFDEFPADVYAKGFIRNYARFLDLDAESLVTEYTLNYVDDEQISESEERRSRLYYWLTIAGLGLLAVVIVVFRFAWVHPNTARQSIEQESLKMNRSVSENQQRSSVPLEEPADRLELRVVAHQKTLVYAEFDGLEKREFVLLPGEQTTWEAEEVIRLRTGNPGGLELYFRGMQLPSLGRSGQVIDKVIQLKDGELDIRPVRFEPPEPVEQNSGGTGSTTSEDGN